MKRFLFYLFLYNIVSIINSFIIELLPMSLETNKAHIIYNTLYLVTAAITVMGAIRCMPKGEYSILRVWFFYAIMFGTLKGIEYTMSLICLLPTVL